MAAVIGALELVYGVTTAISILIKAVIALFDSPEGQVVAEAAQRIILEAEQMFGSSAIGAPQSLGAVAMADVTAIARARNEAKWTYALHTLMGDIPGTSENDAGLALKAAIKAKKLAAGA
jgi:hypothetical protein